MDKPPKLNQLEMLVAVADTGSFGAAAAELECTQSRISHGITELEASLGVRLLARSRSGCIPTDTGYRVLSKARQILKLTKSMVDTADNEAGIVGHVRIACFRSVGTHLLSEALAAISREHPGIRVDIDDSCEEREDVTQAIREGRADIGIAQLPVTAEFVTRPFVSDAYILIAPATLPLHPPISWDQFKGLPYIQLACTGAMAILEQCRAAGFDASISRTLAADTSIAAMVQHGVGYSILPRLAVLPDPAGVRIVNLPIPAQRQFALVALPDTARIKAVQIVMRFIRNKRIVTNSNAFRMGHVSWS